MINLPPPPIIPEVSLSQPFRWIAAYQAANDCAHTAAHAAWRERAKEQFRQIICHLDAASWQETVEGLGDDTVATCLARVDSVLRMAFKESRNPND